MGCFPSCGCVHTTVWMHHMEANKTNGKKPNGNYTRMLCAILKNISQNTSCMATYLSSQKPSKMNQDEQDMQDTAGEAKMNLLVMFFYGPLRMDMPVLDDQQELSLLYYFL